MKAVFVMLSALPLLSACISSSSPPPPPNPPAVVVPAPAPAEPGTVICQDGTKPPCN
jgi:hypothetical protein